VKVGLAESFLSGLTKLFLEHQVAVPDADDKKIVESLESELASLKTKLQESITKTSELTQLTEAHARAEIIKELTEGLADTQRDRIQRLSKEFSFVNESNSKKSCQLLLNPLLSTSSRKPEKKVSLKKMKR